MSLPLFVPFCENGPYNGMGSWMLVDDAGNSSTVFKTQNGQLQEVLAMMGDNAGCPTFCAASKQQQQMLA